MSMTRTTFSVFRGSRVQQHPCVPRVDSTETIAGPSQEVLKEHGGLLLFHSDGHRHITIPADGAEITPVLDGETKNVRTSRVSGLPWRAWCARASPSWRVIRPFLFSEMLPRFLLLATAGGWIATPAARRPRTHCPCGGDSAEQMRRKSGSFSPRSIRYSPGNMPAFAPRSRTFGCGALLVFVRQASGEGSQAPQSGFEVSGYYLSFHSTGCPVRPAYSTGTPRTPRADRRSR